MCNPRVTEFRIALAGLLALLTSLAVAASIDSAAAQAQDPPTQPVRVAVVIEDRLLRVDLAGVTTPVGAIELALAGLPPLESPCELGSGIGACGVADGVLRVVALDPNGWAVDTTLVTAELSASHQGGVEVEVVVLTDVNGVDLAFTVEAPGPAAGSADGGARFPWFVTIAAIGVCIGAVGWWSLRRRDEPGRRAQS